MPPLGEWGHISGELFGAPFGGMFVANPPPANPFSKPLTWVQKNKDIIQHWGGDLEEDS